MSIYQHFRSEEKEFIDQVLNWREAVQNTYAFKLTDFLDPREQEITKQIIGSNQAVKLSFFGGIHSAERKRAIIYPDYYECAEDDFQLSLFEVDYPKKFVTIEHPQVLGSLMSLGLKRGRFGDILIYESRIQIVVSQEIEEYIVLQLESIGKATVSLRKLPLTDAIHSGEAWSNKNVTVSSLRLDTVISSIYNFSRQKAQVMIQHGAVKINWMTVENPASECCEGDIISVRGYGRSKMIELEGKTKKDKWKITVGVQK